MKAFQRAKAANHRMDGSVETRQAEAEGQKASELRLTPEPATLRGWVAPDPEDPDSLPEIALDITGFTSCIITAEPHRDAAGRFRLTWPLPAGLRDGVARPARAFHMISGLELAGSPLTLQAAGEAPSASAEQPSGTGLRWPEGLAGERAAPLLSPLAEGLYAEAEAPARTLRFELLAEAEHGGGARRGLRLLADAVAGSVTLHIHLGAPVAEAMRHWRIIAWLPEATESHLRARLDITLERREGGAFHEIRRLRRSTLFRRRSEHAVEIWLSAGEAALLAAEGVWLGLRAHRAKGLSAWLPEPAPVLPLPEDGGFEDARLHGAFGDAVQFVRVHGEARAEGHALLPALWQAPPPLRQPACAAGGAHPFTQVILPIYNGHEEVKQCLHALRAAATGPMQVVMVDDGSRDFTAEMLRAEAAADPRFVLHRRDINRGYTKSINEGVLLTGADWVVVLNSDTLVPPGWLDRLHAAARARPGTGMVGPLSNAATWQSIPAAKRPDGSWSTNDMIEPRHLHRMQAILDRVSERAFPEFPVLNGFCTMIAREVFQAIGLYDEDAFPMGYGEETDLCLRARRAGFRLTLADDGFVYHHKSVSFGGVARARLSRAGGLEMTNKHAGVIVPALERMMQDCAPLGRLRARLTNLAAELD
ncbi:MAG: glycosyltransferase family 2 protein [Roseococcus sp.]|nr:glycosyltransferase family 2 protein [Roseococcus sp.]